LPLGGLGRLNEGLLAAHWKRGRSVKSKVKAVCAMEEVSGMAWGVTDREYAAE
jgi:hypothetical protein